MLLISSTDMTLTPPTVVLVEFCGGEDEDDGASLTPLAITGGGVLVEKDPCCGARVCD